MDVEMASVPRIVDSLKNVWPLMRRPHRRR